MKQLPVIERSFALDDIAIRAGGSGRTVVAYAAVFDSPYEVRDFEGHYFEQIHRSAFNRAITNDVPAVCLFNHGFTPQTMQPSDRYGMPLGTPLEVRADTRGLLTVTEYAKTDLADEVLELIRAGSITSQSFRGPIYQSRPAGNRDGLRIVERVQLGVRDYGPTAFPVAREAVIVGVRSQAALLEQLDDLTDEERAELLAKLTGAPLEPVVVDDASGEPTDPPDPLQEPTVEVPPTGPSLELLEAEQAQRRRRAAL